MRAAEINGRIHTLRTRVPGKGPRIAALKVKALSGFKDIDVSLDNAFLAICGGTGTGKSTLLQAIYAGLKSISADLEEFKKGRIAAFTVSVKVEGVLTYEDERDFSADVAERDGYPDKVFLDTIDDRTDLSRRAAVGDVSALKEGVEPFELDADALAFLKLICRKDYSKVAVYETSPQPEKYYPHFEVEEAAASYSSEDMGSGEHSAFYLAWRLSTAPANSVVLLEEPEALLPPSSHSQMCAMVATFAQKRGLLPIFTTHSMGIVEFLADGDVISLSRVAGRTVLPASTEAKAKVLAKLGLLPRKPLIALVEDVVGRAVLAELVNGFGFSEVLEITPVVVEEGAGGIKTLLDMLPADAPADSILGFLDGDMEGEAKSWTCKARVLFLPLTDAPEREFLASMETHSTDFAAFASRPESSVVRALERTSGKDHHDRFREIGAALGFETETFTRLAFNHFVRTNGLLDAAKDFAEKLAIKTGVVPPDLE